MFYHAKIRIVFDIYCLFVYLSRNNRDIRYALQSLQVTIVTVVTRDSRYKVASAMSTLTTVIVTGRFT